MTHKIPNAQINDEISQKKFQLSGPFHVFFKMVMDKLDNLGSPKTKLFFESFFFIGQGTSSTGKWIWNLLGFSSFISILGQCVISLYCFSQIQADVEISWIFGFRDFKIYDALECLNIFKEIKDEPTIILLIFEALHYPIVAAINFY